MSEDRRETIVWDNIPEWALYALEYGMDEDLFITRRRPGNGNRVHHRKFPQRLCHVGGIGNRTASSTAIRHSASPARPTRSLL